MAEKKATGEQFYLPPPKLSKWEGFKLFMWDSDRREFMGRTAGSWGKVGLFYLIFYAGLSAFFAVMLVIFYQTLDENHPKWTMEESVIGSNPGLGFRPMPPESNSDSTLVWFRHGETGGTWQFYKEELDRYFKREHYGPDEPDKDKAKPEVCVRENDDAPVCSFKRSAHDWGKCASKLSYGFKQGTPCILVKLNKIYGWMPNTFSFGETSKDKVQDLLGDHQRPANDSKGLIWLTCDGENPADKENIGKLTYYPEPGFSVNYFPYTNTKDYLAPFVFVHFESVVKGVLINIECRAWAKNIAHGRAERRGSVHFELMVD